jgi:hypothetical protein
MASRRAAVISAMSAKAPKGKTPGLSRAVTRGVPPLRLRSTCGLARRRCLAFLLANQTALAAGKFPVRILPNLGPREVWIRRWSTAWCSWCPSTLGRRWNSSAWEG